MTAGRRLPYLDAILFLLDPLQSELGRDVQQLAEARPQQSRPNVRRVVRPRIGPNQSPVGLPKSARACVHDAKIAMPAGFSNAGLSRRKAVRNLALRFGFTVARLQLLAEAPLSRNDSVEPRMDANGRQ